MAEPVDVWGIQEVSKVAAYVPMTQELFDDNRFVVLAEQRLSSFINVSVSEMFEAMERERMLTITHGPMLRPTRADYDRVMEPIRSHERKVRNMRYNLGYPLRGRPAATFRRAAKR